MQTVPGWARACSRAAMLTPSPKISSGSTTTSPRLIPILNSRRRGRSWLINGARGTLHLDGAAQRVYHAGKVRQQAVTCGAHNPPAMPRDQRVDNCTEPTERPMCGVLVLTHQAAEPDHVDMQDGCELPLPQGGFPWGIRRVIEQCAHRDAFDLTADDAHYTRSRVSLTTVVYDEGRLLHFAQVLRRAHRAGFPSARNHGAGRRDAAFHRRLRPRRLFHRWKTGPGQN